MDNGQPVQTIGYETRRWTAARATREEIRNQVNQGKLVYREAVEKEMFRLARTVRDALENIPARIAGVLAAERNQEKCFALLQSEIQQALEGLPKAEDP